jgi:cell division protein FtsB
MIRGMLIVLVVLFIFLQYRFWFGEGSMRTVIQLRQQVATQQAENAKLTERNNVLAAEVQDLQSGHQAVEESARHDLGMIKKGETFYQVVK